MLEYAEALTLTPKQLGPQWIKKLRTAGFADEAIHDITQIAAYFNYINRIADALGVELDEFIAQT